MTGVRDCTASIALKDLAQQKWPARPWNIWSNEAPIVLCWLTQFQSLSIWKRSLPTWYFLLSSAKLINRSKSFYDSFQVSFGSKNTALAFNYLEASFEVTFWNNDSGPQGPSTIELTHNAVHKYSTPFPHHRCSSLVRAYIELAY